MKSQLTILFIQLYGSTTKYGLVYNPLISYLYSCMDPLQSMDWYIIP